MRQRMAELCGSDKAYDYCYRYPGLQKVVQAAGRIIRSPTDTGVLQLLDDRYAEPQNRALLPPWWVLGVD